MTLSATTPDLLRLVAVPVFAWVALRDLRTRRVSSTVWVPLALVGAVTLVWDGWIAWNAGGLIWTHEFLIPATISLGVVVTGNARPATTYDGNVGNSSASTMSAFASAPPKPPNHQNR